jgi:hypothetical protein
MFEESEAVKDAIDLINRKNERFAELIKQFNIQWQAYDRLYKESLQLKSEIERLQKLIDDNCDVCIERERANGRAEGIKEVLEKVKEVICSQTYPAFDADGKPVNVWRAKPGYDAIDQIAKEMGVEL